MNEKKIIYFVTGNKHKYYEIAESFKNSNIEWKVSQKEVDTLEIQDNNLKKVAIYKLKSVLNYINDSFFIEDAGFFVEVPLKGFPGAFSSFVFKKIGNEGIIRLIDDFGKSSACFKSVIALYFKPLEELFTFEGLIRGKVSSKIRGNKGFGFDPIFIPDKYPNKTFAELSIEQKNSISHRGMAIQKLITFLREC